MFPSPHGESESKSTQKIILPQLRQLFPSPHGESESKYMGGSRLAKSLTVSVPSRGI